jgi:hypothetical protein
LHIIARLRDGLRVKRAGEKPWLLRPPDAAAKLSRRFAELDEPKRRAAIEHVRAVAAGELPKANEQYLAGCGVFSATMREWLVNAVARGDVTS